MTVGAAGFVRDRATWTAYVMLGWYAYLQASPGLIVPHLRAELDLDYTLGGLYVTAFAAGSAVAGLVSARLEQLLGRRALIWAASLLMAAGTTTLAAGRTAGPTLGAVLVTGVGAGLLLAMIQALLSDRHGERRTVALAEANVAASCGYLLLVVGLSAAAGLGAGWRAALLASLVVPALTWWRSRPLEIDPPRPADPERSRRLPGAFWLVAALIVCCTSMEWSIGAWGTTFVQEAGRVSADTAVTLMACYFGAFLAGRVVGSRLARRHPPTRLLAGALAVAAAGFAIFWTARGPGQLVPGLLLLGLGVANLFPMAVAAAVSVAPDQAGQVSGRVVSAAAVSIMLAPVSVGALADAASLRAALGVVPALLALSAVALVLSRRTGLDRGTPDR